MYGTGGTSNVPTHANSNADPRASAQGPMEGGVYKIMEERGGVGQRTLQMKNALARTIEKELMGSEKLSDASK